MKRVFSIGIITVLLLLLLTGCDGGNVAEAEYVIGESESYSESDISTAMDRVCSFFKAEFTGCSLVELSYTEDVAANAEWAEQFGCEEAIVLSCVFSVDEEPNATNLTTGVYEHYKWVLGRSDKGVWQLKTLGF